MRGALKMTKKSIKAESLKRLRAIMEDYKTDEELYSSKPYKNLQHFFNQYEKDNAEEMVSMIRKGYTNQQIIKSINERTRTTMAKEETTISNEETVVTDPVAVETEKVFIGYHLADGPVEVQIDDPGDDENGNEMDHQETKAVTSVDKSEPVETSIVQASDETDKDKKSKPYILSDDPAITKKSNKETDDKKHDKKTEEDKLYGIAWVCNDNKQRLDRLFASFEQIMSAVK